jgi:hypothetical protein
MNSDSDNGLKRKFTQVNKYFAKDYGPRAKEKAFI